MHSPDGIYVLPEPSLNVWHAVMFVHDSEQPAAQETPVGGSSSPYAGGIFRFKLMFPDEYPDLPPTVRFSTDMFHPLVNSNGSFLMIHKFPVWQAKKDFVVHILHYLKHSFTSRGLRDLVAIVDSAADSGDPLRSVANSGAFTMLKTERPIFDKLASNCVVMSRSNENLFYDSMSMTELDSAAASSDSLNSISNNNNNSIIKFSSLSDRKLREFTARLKSGQPQQLVNITNAGSGFFSSFDLLHDVKSGLSQFFAK